MDNKSEENKIETTPDIKIKRKSKSREYIDALLFAGLVAIFLKVFFLEAYRIPTGSMENTLLIGDFLLVNKFVYGATTPRNIPFTDIRIPYFSLPSLREPHQGDVVVFDFPGYRDEVQSKEVTNYIKRLVGEPGDTILIRKRILYVNSRLVPNAPDALIEPFPIHDSTMSEPKIFPRGSKWNEDNYGPIVVPKKGDVISLTPDNFEMWKAFIMREGHNCRISSDGKVFIDESPAAEYKVKKNYYFMMGDHRTNSLDSRFWGFMPRENVVGEALIIYWSWNPDIPFSRIGELVKTIRWDRIAKIIR
jgi:signal peptidase I